MINSQLREYQVACDVAFAHVERGLSALIRCEENHVDKADNSDEAVLLRRHIRMIATVMDEIEAMERRIANEEAKA